MILYVLTSLDKSCKVFPICKFVQYGGREDGGGVERLVYVHTHCGGRVSPANICIYL